MREISKPAIRQFWIAYDDKTVHSGTTNTNQVTTTGLANMVNASISDDVLAAVSIALSGRIPTDPFPTEELQIASPQLSVV